MFHDLEKSSTRSNVAVQTPFAHLQTCVAHLFVEEEEPEYQGGGKYLKAGDNWRDDYYTLMFMVTVELMTAYDQYESANSGGLTYDMYERFVDVLRRCRSWMKQTEVVLISKEDYARRTPVQPPVIRQEVRPPRGHESVALSTLQDEVRDLKVKMTKLVEHEALYSTDRPQFYATLKYLSSEMVKVTDDQATIAQLLARVAALERPFYRRFTRAAPPDRTPPATNMTTTALLRRMDEFNS